MAEYIDREKLLNCVPTPRDIDERISRNGAIADMVIIISSALAADVAPVVHGRWIQLALQLRHPYAQNYFCSNCEKLGFATNYCPHCGAKMDLEGK